MVITGGGGVCLGGECLPGGLPGVFLPNGVCLLGCVCLGGVYLGDFCLRGCLPGDCTHPAVNRMTDRCKNITFLQLRLWVVKGGTDNTVFTLPARESILSAPLDPP